MARRAHPTAGAAGIPTFAPEQIGSSKTLADRVTDALLSKISGGELPAGSQLPSEQAMALGFGVSRTVIREAVSRLKSEGLIDSRQGRGAFVRTDRLDVPFRIGIDTAKPLESLLHLLEMRLGLDSEIAYLAAERRNREQMAAIRRALADIDRASKLGQDAVAEDLKFHFTIAQATGNPFFPELIQFLGRFLYSATLVTRANENRLKDLAEQTRIEHAAISTAIEQRDAEAAATAARMHMINAAVRIKAADAEFWSSKAGQVARSLGKSSILPTNVLDDEKAV
jgi:GntR family transcriptional repressor for pyruvate dehydrogenase complex